MRIYIPKQEEKNFLKKLNEYAVMDDYHLEGQRVGKTKITLNWKKSSNQKGQIQFWEWIAKVLPVEGVIISEEQVKNEDKILIIGKIKDKDFFQLHKMVYKLSTLKKEKEGFRFNAWIFLSDYQKLQEYSFLMEYQTIYDITEQPCRCKFIFKAPVTSCEYDALSSISKQILVYETEVYTKTNLREVEAMYEQFQEKINRIAFLHHLT